MRTETLREEISVGIEEATSQTSLTEIRTRLMDEMAPEATAADAIKPDHTTPQRMNAAPKPEQLAQEQLRLRVQLRLKINDLRRAHVSEYLLDDVVLRHKGRIAEAVVRAGGALPPGMDGTPLISHAAVRGQTLVDAARDVLTEMSEAAAALLETEQMKDAMLSRIAAATTFPDIEAASRVIDRLAFKPPAAAREP